MLMKYANNHNSYHKTHTDAYRRQTDFFSNILTIKRFSNLVFLIDNNTDMESEKMINVEDFSLVTTPRAIFIFWCLVSSIYYDIISNIKNTNIL